MTIQEEIRVGIYSTLSIEETVDAEPPYKCLPIGDPLWLSLKVTRVLNYLDSKGVVIQVDESHYWNDSAVVEPLIL